MRPHDGSRLDHASRGLCVFTVASIAKDVPLEEVFKGALPFVIAILFVVFSNHFVPSDRFISTWVDGKITVSILTKLGQLDLTNQLFDSVCTQGAHKQIKKICGSFDIPATSPIPWGNGYNDGGYRAHRTGCLSLRYGWWRHLSRSWRHPLGGVSHSFCGGDESLANLF